MSDVILYAAIKENERLQRELIDLKAGGSTQGVDFYETPQNAGSPYTGGASGSYTATSPTIMTNWQATLSPLVNASQTYGFKVCDTSGYYRCQRQCSWSVPTGVSRAQFQLWGPGGGTSNNCCCGGAPFGPSGAYMVIQMDVTPGETYCFCSGCAYCCCGEQTTPGICGSPTWASGPNLSICADSGISCYTYWNGDLNSTGCQCAIPDMTNTGCSPHGCSGWNFCWDSGNDSVEVCHAFSRASWAVTTKPTDRNVKCYGINGLYPHMKVGGDLQQGTCSVSTPVFGYETCVCTENWNGNTCHGHCRHASQGFLQIPGAGAYASRVFGGCRACGGDYGRMGQVCVSWECS